jgi:hypothetical protein
MTALDLYDSLAHGDPNDSAAPSDLAQVAGKLIESSLADLKRIEAFDEEFGSPENPEERRAMRVARAVWHMYAEWLLEALQLFDRASELEAGGAAVRGIDDLDEAIGDAEARVQFTPEKYARAVRQMNEGDVVPVEVLRAIGTS